MTNLEIGTKNGGKTTFTMPKNKKNGEFIKFSFELSNNCNKKESVFFSIKCNIPSIQCCEWLFRFKPEVRVGKWYICKGETSYTEVYEIFNNCIKNSNSLNFSITWPNDGKIVSITPSSFQLLPQERQSLRIEVKMLSPCETNEVVVYPFTIMTKECGIKEQNVTAYCKDCFCTALSQIIKVSKQDFRGSWIEGLPPNSKSVIRFYFDPNETKWKNIKLEQCIEICYEERKSRAENSVNWGLDYRNVVCP